MLKNSFGRHRSPPYPQLNSISRFYTNHYWAIRVKILSELVSMFRRNKFLASLGVVCLLDAGFVISGLAGEVPWRYFFIENAQGSASARSALTKCGIAHVVAWTIAPPAWFFLEAFIIHGDLLPSAAHSSDPALKAQYDRLRVAQDLGAKVWAAILASILFLVPK